MLCRVKLLSWSGSLFSLFYQLLVGKACLLASENMEQVRSSLMAVPNTELQCLSLFNFLHRLEFYQWGSQAWEWGTVQGHMWGSEYDPVDFQSVYGCVCALVQTYTCFEYVFLLPFLPWRCTIEAVNCPIGLSVWPERLLFKVQAPFYRAHSPASL